ncbi:MAG TPA: ABC transporter substrate-binding protein [Candidatus Methylomirabilis sp.]|nr:ABC transporter substrate-binding protein [Candidatus Methylomirabilis sp.]
MKARSRRAVAARAGLITILLVWSGAAEAAGGPLTPAERRGRQVFLRGSGSEGRELTALLGDGATQVSAGIVPCVQCHGWDGRGQAESGIPPSDITWAALTAPEGGTYADGRGRPAHSEATVARAITLGVDPAGGRLAAVMPRYRLSRAETDDLIAYLKRLGDDRDPGVTETSITVGTLLPATGSLAETGRAIGAVLAAYFAEINDQGGVHNRRLQLKTAEPAETAPGIAASVDRFLGAAQVFAMVGPWIAGAERELAGLMAREEVPLVGPFTLFPQVGLPLNRQLFYIHPGLESQARLLVQYAARTGGTQKRALAVVHPESEALALVAETAEAEGKRAGWSAVLRITYEPGRFDPGHLVRDLRRGGPDALVFLGSGGELAALGKAAEQVRWSPTLLLPGSLASQEVLDIPASFTDRVFLSFPTVPSDQTRAGVAEFRALLDKHTIPPPYLAAQLSAYAAAKILVEGLRRAGRDLSREKLVTALEGLYNFETGVTPPISYGPDRRIGTLGAHIVAVDLEKKSLVLPGQLLALD